MNTSCRIAVGLLPLLAAAGALAQDGDDDKPLDRTPLDCITVSRIDQTDAIDDQNIIFRMRGKQVYRNTLPRTCPGLQRENRIAYQSSTSRLCNVDMITVLEDFGVGFRPGFTCRLGKFVPLSEAEVEDIDLRKKGEAGQSAIETSSVEIERSDDAATEPGERAETGEAAPAAESPSEAPPPAPNAER